MPEFGSSTVVYSVCSALTNSFFLEDRCSLSDQKSFILASSRRAFILAMRGGDRANKIEIGIFVSSVTSNDFPHAMPLTAFTDDRGRKVRKWANLCSAMSQFISPEASLLTVKACWFPVRWSGRYLIRTLDRCLCRFRTNFSDGFGLLVKRTQLLAHKFGLDFHHVF